MLYQFAEFELDEEGFSLSRHGKRIPIEPRALNLLLVMVDHRAKLLEKKFLLQAVWQDTYVEETTLTRAIAILRKQLGDDAREPRFIETVPTKGYRFIAPVQPVQQEQNAVQEDPAASPGEQASPSEPLATTPQAEPPSGVEPATEPSISALALEQATRRRWSGGLRLSGAFLIALCSVLVAYLLYRSRATPPLSTRDTLVLADFVNTTGDPAFDIALRQGLLVQLEQSPVLRLASDAQVRRTLKRMGRREDDPLTTSVAREVCQRMGGSVVLDGSITRLGEAFVIGLHARRCSSGEEMDAEQVQVARKEDALHAISQVATAFRGRVGEAAGTLHELDTPLAEATTPSLEALHAFSQGMQTFNAKGSSAAVPLFRYATELDPDFAWAHAWLGRMYADLGNEELSVQSTRRAHDLRDRASDRERFTIDVSYELLVTGNLQKAREHCDAWLQMYPRDVYPRVFLATAVYPAYGQYDRALQQANEAIAIDPDFVVGYREAAVNLLALNRVDEAEKVLQQAAQRKVFLASFVTDAYRIAFLRGDPRGMEQALRTAPRNPWLLYFHAATLARAGQLRQSQELRERAISLVRQSGRKDTEAELMVSGAYTDLFYGYSDRAIQTTRAALKLPAGRYTQALAALALAMAGNKAQASVWANDLRRRFPEDTVLQSKCIPSIQAAIALHQNKPQLALDLLERTSQFGVSQPLYSTYLRGQAELALGQGAAAAETFRAIVDRPGLLLNDPLGNVARLHLAHAYALSGNRRDAVAMVEAVRQQWSGAEEDFPTLHQVRNLTQTP